MYMYIYIYKCICTCETKCVSVYETEEILLYIQHT